MRSPAIDEETFTRGLRIIENNANVQSRLIEQLIDLSRVRINCLTPNAQKTSLVPILETALYSMMPLVSAKGIQMAFRLNASRHAVSADARLLQQAITNIIGNAIKFTPPGGRIDLQLLTRGTRAEITISDTGCGIPRKLLHLVFDPFKQVDKDRKNQNGLGLGLTIAHHIIATHHGTICAKSAGEGKGTTFVVTLPLENS